MRSPRGRLIGFVLVWFLLIAAFVAPADSGFGPTQTSWDTALGTAGAVVGGASAVVFALFAIAVQNAAGRYSPIFLRYIASDRVVRGVFALTLISLSYNFACLGFGATPWRVAGASVVTVSVILALGYAALRVLYLLNPIELAKLVEHDMIVAIQRGMAEAREQFTRTLSSVEQVTGQKRPEGFPSAPAPVAMVREIQDQIAPLLSIAGSAAELGQVDVLQGVLLAVTNTVRVYLLAVRPALRLDDPVLTRTSEELYSLAQLARNVTSLRALPEIVRALGRLADAGVEASSPGLGLGEQNMALMPMGHLKLIALANLSNINSVAPSLAAEQIGSALYKLLEHRVPSSTAGGLERELAPVMLSSLQPFAYHVAGVCGSWLLRLWRLSSSQPGGHLVRAKAIGVLEAFLKAYRQHPSSMEREVALAALVDPQSSEATGLYPTLPSGAAATTAILAAPWPIGGELMKDSRKLADTFVRELLWPAASGEWRDIMEANYAARQALEVAVVLAAISSESLQHPNAAAPARMGDLTDEKPDDAVVIAKHTQEQAAKHWSWVTGVTLGTCSGLADMPSEDSVSSERWQAYQAALDATCGCLWVVLAGVEQGFRSAPLEGAFEKIVVELCELADELTQKWGRLDATNLAKAAPSNRRVG